MPPARPVLRVTPLDVAGLVRPVWAEVTPILTVEKDGEQRSFTSDHIAFHRFVEGVKEEFGL